jgi:hypothetical protein
MPIRGFQQGFGCRVDNKGKHLNPECPGAQLSHPRLDQPFVVGSIVTPVGEVPRISTDLSWTDHWGTFLARWGVGRMDYRVEPGLYAVGDADALSAVFVTANYKMSFDCQRFVPEELRTPLYRG